MVKRAGWKATQKQWAEPIDDAIVSVQITAPDSQQSVGFLTPIGDGLYTITLETTLLGNYDISVIASDNVPNGGRNNSQYVITTEHSFFVSPYEEPTELNSKIYIQYAKQQLENIMTEYCSSKKDCSLDRNTERNLSGAISLIDSALGYFEDGDKLKENKRINFLR